MCYDITNTAAKQCLWWRQWPCQTDMETPPVVCKPCLLTKYKSCPLPHLLGAAAAAAALQAPNARMHAPSVTNPGAFRFPDTWAKPTAEP